MDEVSDVAPQRLFSWIDLRRLKKKPTIEGSCSFYGCDILLLFGSCPSGFVYFFLFTITSDKMNLDTIEV